MSKKPFFVEDAREHAAVSPRVVRATGAISMHFEPVLRNPPAMYQPEAQPSPTPASFHDAPGGVSAGPVDARLDAIERGIAEIRYTLASIVSRLDNLSRGGQPAAAPAAPNITSFPSQPPEAVVPPARPSVLRDPQPASRSALAEQLSEPAAIDTRPLPKPLPPLQVESKRGLDLLPRSYRITVEDKRRGVDLVPLHRALLGMDGVRDMSLLSYNNGVAIVSLEMTGELDPDALGDCISRAMSRGAKVETHNEHTLVVKLAED